jgi:FlaA1/EpsC-like NDP-sugar epimerase
MLRIFQKYYPIRNIFFVIGEGIFIFTSIYIASWIILGWEFLNFYSYHTLKILLITVICQICLYYNELYDFKITASVKELGFRLMQALGFAAITLAVIYIFVPNAIVGTSTFLIGTGFIIIVIVSWRFCYTLIVNRGMFNQKIILLGSADLVKEIKDEITGRKDCGYTIIAEIPESNRNGNPHDSGNPKAFCGQKYEGLADQARLRSIEKIIGAIKEKRNN